MHSLVYKWGSNLLEAERQWQLDGLALELRADATAQDQPATPVGAACDSWLWYCFFRAPFALIASQALQWDPVFGLDQSLFVAAPMMLGLSFLLKV